MKKMIFTLCLCAFDYLDNMVITYLAMCLKSFWMVMANSKSLTDNVQAILSLYEASHLRVHGETILDNALKFTTYHLESVLPNLTQPLRSQVSEALRQPIWKRLTRIEARRYISVYEVDETHDTVLLKFAKLDFNLLQKEHQKELGNLTR
nr:(-)-germacrene D synthase-like [Ipomoea batatas]